VNVLQFYGEKSNKRAFSAFSNYIPALTMTEPNEFSKFGNGDEKLIKANAIITTSKVYFKEFINTK
jgi:hypothetical protein